MSIISDVVGTPIESIGKAAKQFITTEQDKLNYDKQMSEMQSRINEIEAQSNNVLSSWRGGLGWVCVVCIALYYIPQFILADYFWLIQEIDQDSIVNFPISSDSIMNLVYLLLGFGAYRSFEKVFKA